MTIRQAGPVRATDEELDELRDIGDYFAQHKAPAVLLDSERRIELPPSLFAVLCDAVEVLRTGGAVSILPYHTELTTQEAADYLGVSRPYLIGLLEKRQIPYRRLNSHRRIKLGDLEAYKQQQEQARRAALAELTREASELGLYRKPDQNEDVF